MQQLLFIGLAGAVGALSRYGLSACVQRLAGPGFPYGTFLVNVLGCFLFGLAFGLFEHRIPGHGTLRMVALTGFMGAFTTFSTFAYESVSLFRYGETAAALMNIVGQNVLGCLVLAAGLHLARTI